MKERAVIYCRVSTDEEEQIDALDTQILQARENVINNNWVLVDEYIDEAKSGTTTKRRDEYKKLYEDLELNLFDIIVVKSQDRLMRNTKDWYLFIDKLVKNNKRMYFYLENKFYTPDDALITGIRAILAEEYSRDLSKKINSAHKHRQENGTHPVITSSTWGYDNINKTIIVNQKEAEIVRTIFNLCCQGLGARRIQQELTKQNVKGRKGGDMPLTTIRKILRNPLYKGTVVMNRFHHNFNTKETKRNPEEEWIYHENMVEAIVSEEIWNKANKLIDERLTDSKSDEGNKKRIGKKKGEHQLSGKLICGNCGAPYWRKYRHNKNGIVVDWYCSNYIEKGLSACDNLKIKEEDLMDILSQAADDIFENRKDLIISKVLTLLKDVLDSGSKDTVESIHQERERIENQKSFFMDNLFDGTISKENYKKKNEELERKLKVLEKKESDLKEQAIQQQTVESRLLDIKNTLMNSKISNLDKLLNHIEKVVVFDDRIEVYLDFSKLIHISVEKINNRTKKYQYVTQSIYLVIHTESYHIKERVKQFKVSLFV